MSASASGDTDSDEGAVKEYDQRRADEVERRRLDYLELLRRLQHGRASKPDGRVPAVTPFLLIRHAASDLGARPIASGLPFWVSPDIWVVSSDPLGNPVAGEPNTVMARVFNLGAFQAAPVEINFYWGDPSLGLTPATMNHIGVVWTEIPSLTSVEVACPTAWVPTIVNNGHECIIVSCSNWLADPIIAPFNAVADRHVGQRNLHVLRAEAGGSSKFTVQLTNPFPFSIRSTVVATAHRLSLAVELQEANIAQQALAFLVADQLTPRSLLRRYRGGTVSNHIAAASLRRQHRHPPKAPVTFDDRQDGGLVSLITTEPTGQGGELDQKVNWAFAAGLLEPTVTLQGGDEATTLLNAELSPSSYQTVDVRIENLPSLPPEEVVVFHLVQQIDQIVLGGYCVLVLSS